MSLVAVKRGSRSADRAPGIDNQVGPGQAAGGASYTIIGLLALSGFALCVALVLPAFDLAPPIVVACSMAIVRQLRGTSFFLPSNLLAHALLGFAVLGRLLYDIYISVPGTIANKLLQLDPVRLREAVMAFSVGAAGFAVASQLQRPPRKRAAQRREGSLIDRRIARLDLRIFAAAFMAANIAFWIAYTPAGLLSRSEYIPNEYFLKPLVVLGALSYLPLGLALAWRLGSTKPGARGRKLTGLSFTLAAGTAFAMGARDLAFLPVVLALGMSLGGRIDWMAAARRVAVGATLAALLYPVPLFLRTLESHGLGPYTQAIASAPLEAYQTQTAFSIQTLMVGFPLTIETNDRLQDDWAELLTAAANPLPGRFTNYAEAEEQLQLVRFSETAAFPLNGLGLLAAGGPLAILLCCAASGLLFDWLFRSAPTSSSLALVQIAAIGLAGLFLIGLVQYGPRASARVLVLTVLIRLGLYFRSLVGKGRRTSARGESPVPIIDLRETSDRGRAIVELR